MGIVVVKTKTVAAELKVSLTVQQVNAYMEQVRELRTLLAEQKVYNQYGLLIDVVESVGDALS